MDYCRRGVERAGGERSRSERRVSRGITHLWACGRSAASVRTSNHWAGYVAVPKSGAAAGSTTPITHIVVLMQENHAFDNELGYWCNANPGRCPDGGMPSSVTLSDGAVVTPGTTPDIVPLMDHSVQAQAAAIDAGRWTAGRT